MAEKLDEIVQVRVSSATLAAVCAATGLSRSQAVRRALDMLLTKEYDKFSGVPPAARASKATGPVDVSTSSTSPAPGPHSGVRSVGDGAAHNRAGAGSIPAAASSASDDLDELLAEFES